MDDVTSHHKVLRSSLIKQRLQVGAKGLDLSAISVKKRDYFSVKKRRKPTAKV
jgi:hypothetical protein